MDKTIERIRKSMKLLQKKTTARLSGLVGIGTLGAISVTTAVFTAPKVSADNVVNNRTNSRTGYLDVSVDTQDLKDAISLAESQGVQVFRDATRVRTGNATETEKYRQEAIKYYQEKIKAITELVNKYKADKAKYEQDKNGGAEEAKAANAELSALRISLAALGRGVQYSSQPYSEVGKNAAIEHVKDAIKFGERYRDTKNAIDSFNAYQSSMVGFHTHADQGKIKLQYQDVVVSNAAELEQYKTLLNESQTRLNEYIAGLGTTTGAIPEGARPTFVLFTLKMNPTMTEEMNKPVSVPTFEAKPAEAPVPPQINYAFYDIRQTSDTDNDFQNKDGEKIVIKSTDKDGGKLHQAMKGQTVGIVSTNDPLPAGRWDKYHALTVTVNLPEEGAELDEGLTKKDNPNWTTIIDKEHNRVIFRATDDYLVDINEKQAMRNGSIGGIMKDPFQFEAPTVYTKLTKDNMKYTFSSDIMINHEYRANSGTVHVQTNQADPKKTNKDDKGVTIDGKTVFFGSTNNYHLTWDFDQYKGVNIDRDMQQKGLDLIDYYPSDALDFDPSIHHITLKDGDTVIAVGQADGTFKDANGKTVEGVTWTKVDKYEGIDRKGPAIKVSISGYDHPYYKQYVETGKSLTVTIPMRTRVIDQTPGVAGGVYGGNTYTNVFYQSDFGNIYQSNEVTNTVTTLNPRKDAVLSISQLASLDIKSNPTAEIEHKTYFQYRASGSKLALDVLGRAPESYSITDAFHEADQYDGRYFVESNGDIFFKEGTALYNKYRKTGGKLPKDSDVTKFTTQTIVRNLTERGENSPVGAIGDKADSHTTIVRVGFDQDFLDQIDHTKSTFQMDVFFQVKRVKNVNSVDNIFQEEVNGIMFDSTETLTNTRLNDVDKLKDDVKSVDDKITNATNSIGGALSVIRRQIQNNSEAILDNKRAVDKHIKVITETLADHHDQIEANRIVLVSVRRLVNMNANNININKGRIDDNRKRIDDNTRRIDAIEPKLEQADSSLTIYTSTVTSDAEALLYATNHGIASGSIKSITLDEKNHYVVTYNTSKTAINGGPDATNKPVNVQKVSEHLKNVTIYNQPNREAAQNELLALGYKMSKVSKVEVDGRDYTFTIDMRDEITPVADVPEKKEPVTFSMTLPIGVTETAKVDAINNSDVKKYIKDARFISDSQYEIVFNLEDGGLTQDEIIAKVDELTKG